MRIWLFRLIALCLPLLILLLMEISLRQLFPVQPLPLFKPNPANPAYLVTEAQIVQRYFPAGAQVPRVELEPSFVLAQKPEQGIRILVQGGSTAAGYPYGLGASIAGMLEQRLRRTFPERHIEVINTALSAVNSYTLLDFADEIIALQPDAVLIYAGHNEYLGLLGVGSNYIATSSPRLSRWLLALRQLRTVQLLEQGFYQLKTAAKPAEPADNSRTFMAKVARDKHIALHSATYKAGLTQFTFNMSQLLAHYQAAGIPVYISTIASNLADQAPFESAPLSTTQQQQLHQLTQLEPAAAQDALASALAAEANASGHAMLHYQLAQWYRQQDQIAAAKNHFVQAREHDLLRFRAPLAINRLITSLADSFNAILVDSEAAFVAHSPHGLIGRELMLEHLHPNVQGYFLIADSFYLALYQQQAFGRWPKPVPPALAWQERPLTPAEEEAGALRILQLTADYPFRASPVEVQFPKATDIAGQLASAYVQGQLDWLSMQQQMARYYHQQKDGDMLLKTLKIIADALPHDGIANVQAAQILMQAKRQAEARHYLHRALLTNNVPPEAELLLQQLSR
ncbi:SGNH/GDSL hydrolase family protein [Arsukibacterium sp.]|uniref:SGNH/GDSL hydrolase family protein n=1 Tax=Arsukibacterium sp. TaxID=1977258 RepID=UPI002FDAC9DE